MGVVYSPNIVKNGLVMYLDGGNARSYPGSGNTWFDLSGHGNHAFGSSAITNNSLLDTQPYNTASTSILNNNIHSIFFMLQINSTNGSWSKIFGYEPSGTDRSPGIWRWPSARRLHWRYDPSNSSADFSVDAIGDNLGTEFAPNVWYYVGVTKNGAAARSYTNGVFLGQQSVSNPKTSGNSTIRLYPAYGQGTSRMAIVQIYNRALNDAEVFQNFNALRKRFGH